MADAMEFVGLLVRTREKVKGLFEGEFAVGGIGGPTTLVPLTREDHTILVIGRAYRVTRTPDAAKVTPL